jgi:two-component system heavy metal sensor histidine kinase CusS
MSIRRNRWPISSVLTLFFTLSTSVILMLATGFLYQMMRHSLENDDVHDLADEAEILRSLLRDKPDDLEALKDEVQSEGAARRFAKYYLRVLHENDQVVIETSDMVNLLPPAIFPPATAAKGHEPWTHWQSPSGNWYILTSASGVTGGQHGTQKLQLALDVTQDEEVLSKYRTKLFIVLVLGIGCSALVSHIIARRGLLPLTDIAEAAQKITASQLHERITPRQWPQELTKLAAAFDAMLGRLEASFNRLSQLSNDLAHEFRTPIATLRVQAEVALQRTRSVEEYQRVLESSLEEFERLSRMVESLLFLARSENAETTLQRTSFESAAEIKSVCAYYEAAAAEKQITIGINGNEALLADSILFRRAVSNLLANAIRHTDAGGKISIQSLLENDAVLISVEDTGCGIAEEHIGKVFDRFYRVDKARNHQGAGLGLAIVKSIMELHGGSVELTSQPGTGTAVTLRFPATSATPLAAT